MRPRKKDRHLPPCVYQRHGSYWLVRAGKWTRLGKDLPSAMQAYGRAYTRPPGSMPAVIEMALEERRRSLKPNTWKQYQYAARRLSAILADCSPEQITPRDVASIRMEFAKTPTTGNRCLSVLRIVFDYALDQGLVESNPVIGAKRNTETPRDRLLTTDEYVRIREAASPRMQIVMDLCYLTGQRVSDVLTIRYADISDTGIAFRQGKTGARLLVAWTPELRAVVDSAKALHGNVRAFTLLHTQRGKAPSYRATFDQWQAAVKASGVENAHIHDIRAMSATAADASGLDAKALLGHSSEAMTKRYLRSKQTPIVNGPSFGHMSKKVS